MSSIFTKGRGKYAFSANFPFLDGILLGIYISILFLREDPVTILCFDNLDNSSKVKFNFGWLDNSL